MNIKANLIWLFILTITGRSTMGAEDIVLGQGIMAGEATRDSIILQSRLTRAYLEANGDISGSHGIAWFQVSLQPTFEAFMQTSPLKAISRNDFIVKTKIDGLDAGKRYFYRLVYGPHEKDLRVSRTGQFHTLPLGNGSGKFEFAVVSCMNYYFFHHGPYDPRFAYKGKDRDLGYPALKSILDVEPEFVIFTGDNVYYDHPNQDDFQKSIERGLNPVPSSFNGAAVTDGKGVRHKFHEQFSQPRFHQLLRKVFTYWQKDDHDFRCNDCDPYVPNPISREAGAYFFREQLPVVHPVTNAQPVFRSYRINDLVQIWLVDTREYRSRNAARDGPEKTLWGTRQHKWLKATLSQSDAVFKLLISPTPMVGPDGYGKNDNHANLAGFRYEREAFFSWLRESGLLEDNFYLICGDRHWQYHAIDPSGVEEFSVGTLVDANAVVGFFPGDETSSDPEGEIRHLYHPEEAKGGFLNVSIDSKNHVAMAKFSFYDVRGKLQYQVTKKAEYQGGERAGMDRIRHSSGWPNE